MHHGNMKMKMRKILTRWRNTRKYRKFRDYQQSPVAGHLSGHRGFKMAKTWRKYIIRKITKKITQIKKAGLSPAQVRNLNDEINNLLEEKKHWNDQIERLGGPDYSQIDRQIIGDEGREVTADAGYKYFGVAEQMLEERELFEKESTTPQIDLFESICSDKNISIEEKSESKVKEQLIDL